MGTFMKKGEIECASLAQPIGPSETRSFPRDLKTKEVGVWRVIWKEIR